MFALFTLFSHTFWSVNKSEQIHEMVECQEISYLRTNFPLYIIIDNFWKLISSKYILSLAVTDLVENRHLMRRRTCGQSKLTYDECKTNSFFYLKGTLLFFILCLILYLDIFLRPPMCLEFLLLKHYCAWKNSNQPDLAN